VGNVQTSGNIAISTADLKLGAASLMSVTGSQSIVTINSPAGSGLTVELPSGSYATIQTPGPKVDTIKGVTSFADLVVVALSTPAGSISFIPASGQALVFSDSGAKPTTLHSDGLFITNTNGINAPTTVGSGVTLASNGVICVGVTDSTLFNNGVITSSAPAAEGVFGWLTVNVYSTNHGSLTLAGSPDVFTATSIANPNNKGGPVGPAIRIVAHLTELNVNQSVTFNTTPLGFVSVGALDSSDAVVNLAAD